MEDLSAIIKLLTAQKVKQIEIISEEAKMSVKSRDLYNGIKNGEFKTDLEASLALYNENENYSSYKKLKYRLKKRLLNTLFFIDIQEYSRSNLEKATIRSYKNWAAAKILMSKGLLSQSYNISEILLKTTLQYDLVELSLLIVRDLRKKYGLINYNKYKYEKYKQLYYELNRTLVFIEKAEEFYIELGKIILNSKSYTYNEEIKIIEVDLVKLMNLSKEIDSYMLRYYSYNAIYFLNMIKRDNNKLLIICNQALDYFTRKKGFGKLAAFSFTQKKGIQLLLLKNYDNALVEFKKCLEFKPKPGSTSWHFIHNYLFSTYLLSQDYFTAYEIASFVLNHKSYKHFTERHEQTWHLKEAFIHFLIKTGKIDLEEKNGKSLRAFKLSRFLNEVPEISKDKRGYNITINIIQMLFLIVDKKYDAVLDKLASLKQYNFRYLKRPEFIRSSTFIKMLLKIPEGDYVLERVKKKADKFYTKLLETPHDFSDQSIHIEIIPYEKLWEVLLDNLD